MKKSVAAVLVEAVSGPDVMRFFGTMRTVRLAEREGLVYWREDGRLWLNERIAFSLCLPPRARPAETVETRRPATDTGLAPLTEDLRFH